MSSFLIRQEIAADSPSIETLTKTVFGPSIFTRAAYLLREGVPHETQLSFVAEDKGMIIGSVRLTKVLWGKSPIYMLGPLGVLPNYKSRGIGKALMGESVKAAKELGELPLVMLVGDAAYYSPFGFKPIPSDKIRLPRPVDPSRVLVCDLWGGGLSKFEGKVIRFMRS